MNHFDPHELTAKAHEKVLKTLKAYQNEPTFDHSRALYEIALGFSRMASGLQKGRWAYPLFTGGGKTSSIIAWLSSVHELELDDQAQISVAVCASRVEALCELKRSLIAEGVPAEKIGLVHSYKHDRKKAQAFLDGQRDLDPGFSSEPATDDNEDRPILLVTHNRVKGKGGLEQFNLFQGKPRSLLIWDESLLRSESRGVREDLLRSAIGWRAPLIKKVDQTTQDAFAYVNGALEALREEIERQRKSPGGPARTIKLPPLTNAEVVAYKEVFGYSDITSPVRDLLEISQQDLRVLDTGLQNGGFLQYDIVVPPGLENIIILDASHAIRELCQLDKTIKTPKTYPDNVVSYEEVQVFQIPHAAGRDSITKALCERVQRHLIKELVDIVKGIPEEEAILFFTFVPRYEHRRRKYVDCKEVLEKAFQAEGIAIDATVLDHDNRGNPIRRPRFCWLTHGNETSTNRYAYTTNQIWVGVLYRGLVELASQIAGQSDDLLSDIPQTVLHDVCESELAYCYHQGFNRSACRTVRNGKARPTRIWVTFKHDKYDPERILRKAMRGLKWETYETKYLKTRHQTKLIAKQLADHLDHLAAMIESGKSTMTKVSAQKLKEQLGLQGIPNGTWQRALKEALGCIQAWASSGRSVVFQDAQAFGFTTTPGRQN